MEREPLFFFGCFIAVVVAWEKKCSLHVKIEYRDFDQLIGCLYLKDIGQQKKRRGMKRVYVCIFVNAYICK